MEIKSFINIPVHFNKVMNTQQQQARNTIPVIVTRVIMAEPALQTILDTQITIVAVQMDLLDRIVSFKKIDLFKVLFEICLLQNIPVTEVNVIRHAHVRI